MSVAIGSLVLAAGASDFGTPGWYLQQDGLVDWDAVTDSKTEIRERPQAEGAASVPRDVRSSLPFSISGIYVSPSADPQLARIDVQNAKVTLSLAAGQGRSVPVVVDDVDGSMRRRASVRKITPDTGYSVNSYAWTMDLVAPDPLKYGAEVTLQTTPPSTGGGLVWPLGTTSGKYCDWGSDGSSGRVSFLNFGTAPAWPILRATGGMSGGFTATSDAGDVVRFERVIPAGSVVQINQRTGAAWIDAPGNDVSRFVNGRGFFSFPPQSLHWVQFAPIGTTSGSPVFELVASPAFRG